MKNSVELMEQRRDFEEIKKEFQLLSSELRACLKAPCTALPGGLSAALNSLEAALIEFEEKELRK
jgi:hypothetical protein